MGNSSSKEQKQSPSLSYLNTSEEGGDARAGAVATGGGAIADLPSLHGGPTHTLCRADEHNLVSAGVSKVATVYCWSRHVVEGQFRGPKRDITKLDYNPASHGLHGASRDHTIYGWRWPQMGNTLRSSFSKWEGPDYCLHGHTLAVTALASSTMFPHLLTSGSRDNCVRLWDVSTQTCTACISECRNLVTGLQWIEGERCVLQSSEDKSLRVWDLRSSSLALAFPFKHQVQTCCAVSRDRNYFLSGSSGTGRDGAELTLWDRRSAKPLKEYRGHTETVQSCLFHTFREPSSDEMMELIVSSSSDSTLRLWNQTENRNVCTKYLSGAGPISSVVSLSNEVIASSTFNSGVKVWGMTRLNQRITRNSRQVQAPTLSPGSASSSPVISSAEFCLNLRATY